MITSVVIANKLVQADDSQLDLDIHPQARSLVYMATNSTPISHSHDLTRDQIISRFRDRIAQGKRTKLTKDELGQLILHFIDRLQPIKSTAKIRALCKTISALLEFRLL